MPRQAAASEHEVARLRVWFGLGHEQVAQLLEVSADAVRAWERGRRSMPANHYLLLVPLFQQVPTEVRQGFSMRIRPTLAETQQYPAGKADELDFRRRECWHKAIQLRPEASKLAQKLSVAQRWTLALPALRAAYANPAFLGGPLSAEQQAWVERWLRRQARPLPPGVATRWHLLRARIAGYAAKAEALTIALGTPPSGRIWELFQSTTELGF